MLRYFLYLSAILTFCVSLVLLEPLGFFVGAMMISAALWPHRVSVSLHRDQADIRRSKDKTA